MSVMRRGQCIIPPYLLQKLLESDDPRIREAALESLVSSAVVRAHRSAVASLAAPSAPTDGRRTIFDCKHRTALSRASVVRTEDGAASADSSVNQAYDGLGATRDFYREVLQRNSIDDRGMRLDGYVHRGRKFNNAFWDGREMVFGDGDGVLFTDFTGSLDVIAHELTHGVTQFTANLNYADQSGALNESVSDVFGSVVKQWKLGQTADQADWLIGSEVFTPGVAGDALRSMKAPGTAYDNAQLGKDPQPAHMRDYVHLPDTQEGDNGGVHINSGIPNRAFYLAAMALGGHAWERAGKIWYVTLRDRLRPDSGFRAAATLTVAVAGELFGTRSTPVGAVRAAWKKVGVL
jgi:Zn-dependent metalloprotease